MSNTLRSLTTKSDWEDALESSKESPVLIFKHSTACSVSAQAHDEMEQLLSEAEVPVFKVVVQKARSVSNEIESDLGVRHESPQIILLDDQDPVFHTSHFDVTVDTVQDALQHRSTPSA